MTSISALSSLPMRTIDINPLVGEFSDVECGKHFVIPFTVRNIGNRICTIRCVPPKSKCFKLLTSIQSVAPGMNHIIKLQFISNTPGEVHDQLVVRCDEGDTVIPLHAWFPTPNIICAGDVFFGDVSVNNPVDSKKLKLKNLGKKDGVFKFVINGNANGVSIIPSHGTVTAGRDIEVAVHLFATEVGPVKSTFLLEIEEQASSRQLNVTANVVEAKVLVVRPTTMEPISQVSFGKLYYGQKREVQLMVKNTGQGTVSFSVSPPDADTEDLVAAPFPIQVFPREGRISRDGTSLITFKFAPQMLEQKQGWDHQLVDESNLTRTWDFPFEIDILETEQKINLNLSGTAVPTIVRVSEKTCRFGECPANSYVDFLVNLANHNGDMPVLFDINRVAHFASKPSRGIIGPKQETTVKLTFQPKQLGNFEGHLVVSLNGGIVKIPITLIGQSTTMGPKAPKTAGIDAILEDYEKPLKIISNAPGTGAKSEIYGSDKGQLHGAAYRDMILLPEHEQKQIHNRLYNTYLANSRAIREVKAKSQSKCHLMDNPDDLGMIPAEGLEPPEPIVSRRVDRLPWPAGDGKGALQIDNPAAVHKIKIDENKLVKKKFRKEPSNLNEIRECKMVLSPKDIQSIIIPVKLLDFQKVSIFSVNSKPFYVHNGLKTFVYVSIAFSRDELSQSTPTSQVIPPGQTAGFDITFRSEVAQTFQQAIYFTINDVHKLKFVVFAEAVPVELSVSTDNLSFRFPDFGHELTVNQNITIVNPGNSDANFIWSLPSSESAFSFHPPSGTVPPCGNLTVTVSYKPPLGINESKTEALLNVIGGTEPKKLLLAGSVPPVSCTWSVKDARIDFKKIAVGSIRTQRITIRNNATVSTVFAFDTSLLIPGVTLSHPRGRIPPNSTEDITVQLKSAVPQHIKCSLNCHIRGMKQLLKCFIVAEAKIPQLYISESYDYESADNGILNFGGVYVGSSEHRRLFIQNNDDITADLLVDLTTYPNFVICDSDNRTIKDTIDNVDSDLQVPGQGAFHTVRHQSSKGNTPCDETREGTMYHPIGLIYRITINPKETMPFYLMFIPTAITQEETFRLPLTLTGCSIDSSGIRPIHISAAGKRPRLVIMPTMVDFGARVVVRDNTSKIPNRILIKLSNETEKTLTWELEGSNEGSDAFRVEPTKGKLLAGQGTQLQVTFISTEVRSYAAKYTVYLDGDKESKYMDISARGFGVNPGLMFDRREVILPPVPLDSVATGAFHIGNDGYDSLELKYRIPGDGKLPITLHFPESNFITTSTSMIPVEVHFTSSKPMTFTVNIDFYDDADGGSTFSIPVTCTADNSLVTCHGYIKYIKGKYSILADNEKKPILFKDHYVEGARLEPTVDDEVMGSYQYSDAVLRNIINRKQLDRIHQWLNSSVIPDSVDDLMGCLQLNHGKMLIDIIEMLFGHTPQIPKPNHQPRDGVLGQLDAFDNILLFLKQYGACVSEVRSEYLINYDDYVKCTPVSIEVTQNQGKTRQRAIRILERNFETRALHCWLTVLTQVIRVFFFSRINWKVFKALPTTAPSSIFSVAEKWGNKPDPSCVGSNLYSTAEAILLKWLSMNLSYYFPKIVNNVGKDQSGANNPTFGNTLKNFNFEKDRVRLTNFEEDLRDCRAFAACVMTYIPGAIPKLDPTKDFGIIANPETEEDVGKNAALLIDTLHEYGLSFNVSPRDIMEGSALDNAMFSAFLFNMLPQYRPKTSVKFKTMLLEKCTKHIELTNPTKWPIDYTVRIDGCDEFKLSDTAVHLGPNSSTTFAISLTPSFIKKVEALCMFISKVRPATMVFNLESDVDSDSCMRTIEGIETPLYDPIDYEVIVHNPFSSNAQFNVQVTQQYVKDPKGYPEEESIMHFPDAFWVSVDNIILNKSHKAKLNLQFLPCVRGTYHARVVFRNDRIGEFAYKIVATGLPPRPSETISLQCEAPNPVSREICIPLRHLALEKAQAQRMERLKSLKTPGGKKNLLGKDGTEIEGKEVLYKVEFLNDKFVGPNPFFNGPKSFFLTKTGEEAVGKKNQRTGSQGHSFNINFTPKSPGIYRCILLLSSSWDVRVVVIDGISRSPGVKAELNFNCPARQQIIQEIPITNSSENEWVVSAVLQGDHFSGPREIRILAGRSKSYTLTFSPTWICTVNGQLVLKNKDTQEKYTYTLKGQADEPLAENTIYVDCKARETRKITVNVPNITHDDVKYQVVTDLPFVAGDTSLFVSKMEVKKYVLHINPQLNGKVTGSLSFIAPNKHYVWFVVQVTVSRPPPEDTIDIEATVREGAVAEITVHNPTDRLVDFLVRRTGDGLYGEDILTIDSSSSAMYQLAFTPTRSGETEGTISFNNNTIGEFWYELKLTAKEATPTNLSFQCEIGKTTSQEVTLKSNLDFECVMTVSSTNNINYTVSPQNLILRPRGTLKATIQYMPSAIQINQDTTITFSHPKAGMWVYNCSGSGLDNPTQMDPVMCVGQVSSTNSVSISFRNPFPAPRRFAVALIDDSNTFALIQKKLNVTLSSFQELQIPVSYTPNEIAEHNATVTVDAADQMEGAALCWEFPIRGVSEYSSPGGPTKISSRARKETAVTIPFHLPLLIGSVATEHITPEIQIDGSARYYKAAASSISVKQQMSSISIQDDEDNLGEEDSEGDNVNAPERIMKCKFSFVPLRPFKVAAMLLLKRQNGGMWRFPLSLEAQPPEVDDVIELEAAVNVVASATFQLYNVLPEPRPFVAYFTPDSPQEFTVIPSKGTLPPMHAPTAPRANSETGHNITVNFTSIQYGKTLIGTLIVDTDDMQWRYEVRGSLPKYKPPTNVRGRVLADVGLAASGMGADKDIAGIAKV